MTTLADYLNELGPLIEQLEQAGTAEISAGKFFEWRIRARHIEDKLYEAAKPVSVARPDAEVEDVVIKPPMFKGDVVPQAKAALAHAGGLREALQNKRVKIALETARALARSVQGASHSV